MAIELQVPGAAGEVTGSGHLVTAGEKKILLDCARVDGTKFIRLQGEAVRVAASIHTVGGLSAHADRNGLKNWYAHFDQRRPVVPVRGEATAPESLCDTLRTGLGVPSRSPDTGTEWI